MSLRGEFARLGPLAQAAIRHDAAVSLFSPRVPPRLPAEVEVLPIQALVEAWEWADYAAFEAEPEQIELLPGLLGWSRLVQSPFPVEILIVSRFACAGTADCGVCAVKMDGRYRLSCKDGPVFALKNLDY